MRTIEVNIYNFDELQEEVQKKLIEKEIRQQNDLYCEDFLYEDMIEEARRLLEEHFENHKKYKLDKSYDVKTWYSLSYCQGDGAMMEFNLIDKATGEVIKIRHEGHYYHELCFDIDTYLENFYGTKAEEELHEEIYELNKQLAKIGWDLVDYEITEEEAKEILNEHEYYANGEIA